MSSSQHPIAYRLERQVGGATKLLATVMGLPLVDGIFPAMVLAGAIDDPVGIVQVGLLVFGGSATVAVILAEMDGTPREQAMTVLAVGVGIIALASVEAAFAPTIESALNMDVFKRFAALVMGAIAAKTASARVGEYLPSPGIIIGFGMLASLQPAGFELVTTIDTTRVLHAAAAAGSGVGFALSVALLGPWLRNIVDIDRFRFGSAVALGVLPLSILGLAPGRAPLAVLAVTSLLALDPGEQVDAAVEAPDQSQQTTDGADASDNTAVTDGGKNENVAGDTAEDAEESVETAYGYPGEEDGDERRPWL
ncbi:DUF5794 domain-containing protein [Haladaptatus pallidirubidus]|uniref:DUF5794 domain-containing protein n=1 Tax=Haladaptatus pallidirubidus TaxID=1008152 RepID=A0AAV3UB96_9EURY|nr:DUF5794 domain-containing protein [Haladaptatus pallidirubidus]